MLCDGKVFAAEGDIFLFSVFGVAIQSLMWEASHI